MKRNEMSDQELDLLLQQASEPKLQEGALQRLSLRLNESTADNVVSFPFPRKSAKPSMAWLSALPLAASLAFGIYLGSLSEDSVLLPDAAYDYLTEPVTEGLSGIEEAEFMAEEDIS